MAELTDEQWEEFVDAIGANTAANQMLARGLAAGGKKAGESLSSLGDFSNDTADSFDALNDQVRNSEDELASLQYAADRVSDAWEGVINTSTAVTQALAKSSQEILANGESFGIMRSFIDPLADGIGIAIRGVGELTAGLTGLGATIPLVGGGFSAAADSLRGLSKIAAEVVTKLIKFGANLVIDGIEQLWSMFEGAASAGVLFANGLSEMNEQRGNLSLTTQEYTDVVKNNRDALTLLGGSVGEGAKRLAAVGKESKVFNEELRAMGITYKEQAENTTEFMASLNRSGQLRLMTDKQIAAASAEYQKNLAVMSSLTGKSVETMKQERDEALKNMAFQAELAKMDPAVRKEMEAALGSMPEGMKKAFQESVIFGKVMTDTGAIVSGANTYIEEYANSVRNGGAQNEEAFQTFRDQIKENAPELRKNLGDLAAAGMAELLGNGNAVTRSINDFAGALYNEITRAESGYKGAVDAMLTTGEKQEESVKQILSGLNSQREMQDQMLHIIEKQALPAATAMFDLISGTMNKGLTDFVAFLNNPEDVTKGIEDSLKGPVDTTTSLFDKLIEPMTAFNQQLRDLVGFDMGTIIDWLNPLNAIENGEKVLDAISDAADWAFGSDSETDVRMATSMEEKFGDSAIKDNDDRIAKLAESEDTTDQKLAMIQEVSALRNKIQLLETEMQTASGTRADNYDGDGTYTGPTRDEEMKELMRQMISATEKVKKAIDDTQ